MKWVITGAIYFESSERRESRMKRNKDERSDVVLQWQNSSTPWQYIIQEVYVMRPFSLALLPFSLQGTDRAAEGPSPINIPSLV